MRHVEDGGRATSEGHRWPLEAKKGKEMDSSLSANRKYQPCQHLDFKPHETDFRFLTLRNCRRIHLC